MPGKRLNQRVTVHLALPAVDPDFAKALQGGAQKAKVQVARTTDGPHRATLKVPEQDTVFHLGHGVGKEKLDVGIMGSTDQHVHFETSSTAKTLVNLGDSQNLVAYQVDAAQVPAKSKGYAMATAEYAYQVAQSRHILDAEKGDIIARTQGGPIAALQSDSGITEVNSGKKAVTIAAKKRLFVSATGSYAPTTTTYKVSFSPTARDKGEVRFGQAAAQGVATFALFVRAIAGFGGISRAKAKHIGKDAYGIGAAGKLAALGSSLMGFINSLSSAEEAIKVSADANVAMHGTCASAFGAINASAGSLGAASMIGATADMKGYAVASLWSMLNASLSSGNSTAVTAHSGGVVIHAKGSASIASDGPVRILGKNYASLRSDSNTAAVYGSKGAYVGTSGGWGAVVTPRSAAIGKVTNADKFTSAKVVGKNGVTVFRKSVVARCGSGMLACAQNWALLQANQGNRVRITSSGCTVTGKVQVDT